MRPVTPILLACLALGGPLGVAAGAGQTDHQRRPNILLAISDDQSYPHASAYGYRAVSTPAFDRVARRGVLFTNGFAASPGCSPCRAALLTGRHTWQLEHAGTHASEFPARYVAYPDLLEAGGYYVGYTGKGWGPGNWQVSGRQRNPAGPSFARHKTQPPAKGINSNDYAANFRDFLAGRPQGAPFCFWFGASEPHRSFERGSGLKAGKKPEDVVVPPFLPDAPEVRADILDYCLEIEWFDRHLGLMLDALEQAGELDNTLVIVTSDNGMAFPRAKANCYEFGIHMPLAVCYAARAPGGRMVDDLVGFVDLTATILDAAGIEHPGLATGENVPAGRSVMNILVSDKQGVVDPSRKRVFSARERHSSSRYGNLGYPQRAMRTHDYLYIRNFAPDRWPAGDPQVYGAGGVLGPMHGAYHDIDGSPTLSLLAAGADDPRMRHFLDLAVARRPAEELYDIRRDPGCLNNLAAAPEHAATLASLRHELESYLAETGDPRMGASGEVFETYKRYSAIRTFPPSP